MAAAGSGVFPPQALSEFSNACLKKLEPSPDPAVIRREVERLLIAFPVLPLTGPVVLSSTTG